MLLVGIMPCRNEDWILGLSARAALMWVDKLVLLDHASVDGTRAIMDGLVKEYPGRVTVMADFNPNWDEMNQRQSLLERARQEGATHIVCMDADEILTANLLCPTGQVETIRGATYHQPIIRDLVTDMPRHAMLELPWIQLRGSIQTMHADGLWGKQWATTAFVDDPLCHWKPDGQGYQHHHRAPLGFSPTPYRPVAWGQGGLMHLQMVSEKRLREKQYRYELCDRLRWPGRKTADEVRKYYSYAVYGYQPEKPLGAFRPQHTLAPVPDDWWAPYWDLLPHLKADSESWYVAECRRMVAASPSIVDGLDSFGVEL
jgi:hypothetical protein